MKVESKTFNPTFAPGMGALSSALLAISNAILRTDAAFFTLFEERGDSNLLRFLDGPLQFMTVL